METQRWKESEKRREEKKKKNTRKSQKKEDVGARNGRQVARYFVFPMICRSRESKSRLAKVAGAEPSGQMRVEQVHADVVRNTCRSQHVYKTHHALSTFGSWDVEKVHTIVAPSACLSQHVTSTICLRNFWILDVLSLGRRKGLCTLSKVSRTWWFNSSLKKRWQAWDIWRRSAKMHCQWLAQYRRHVHQRC